MVDQPDGYTDPLYTLAEASRLTGLSIDALRQRVKRNKLEAVRGNDGLVRVRLTTADREALRLAGTRQPDQPVAGQPDPKDQTIKVLQDNATSLQEALGRERARADQERDRANAATALAGQRADDLRQLGEKLARAEGMAEGLRTAIEAHSSRGPAAWLRSVRAAFRSD